MSKQLAGINVILLCITMLLVGLTIGIELVVRLPVAPPAAVPAATDSSIYSVGMIVPAVDDKGNGVTTDLRVEVKPGRGEVLANIDQLLFITDTQQSIQTAKALAVEMTGIDPKNLDIIYDINTPYNVTVVGGPSAGAAFTIATVAALKRVQPQPNTAITGSISSDGSIGPIGGVLEKAKIAKERGITLFLVPTGQGTQSVTKPNENCSKEPGFVYCETTYTTTNISISNEVGITVVEVSNIREAAVLFGL